MSVLCDSVYVVSCVTKKGDEAEIASSLFFKSLDLLDLPFADSSINGVIDESFYFSFYA